jgi:hypothetical protein
MYVKAPQVAQRAIYKFLEKKSTFNQIMQIKISDDDVHKFRKIFVNPIVVDEKRTSYKRIYTNNCPSQLSMSNAIIGKV